MFSRNADRFRFTQRVGTDVFIGSHKSTKRCENGHNYFAEYTMEHIYLYLRIAGCVS